ncbi:hypothetical protein [Flavobacterium davisii]|uniref:hypothetical protein n=1 Tax=Flavobacterium davisii TaxID=2906077 RepID=UPI0035CF76E7
MEIENIKTALEINNYDCYIRGTEKRNKFIMGGIKDEKSLLKPDNSFNIFIVLDRIKLNYFEGQILIEKKFDDIEALIDFIKIKFPLD